MVQGGVVNGWFVGVSGWAPMLGHCVAADDPEIFKGDMERLGQVWALLVGLGNRLDSVLSDLIRRCSPEGSLVFDDQSRDVAPGWSAC